MTLYIKSGCPWCVEAERWLKARGYRYEVVDVLRDREAFRTMKEISGQTLAPTLEVDGLVLPDFDTGQLEAFLARHKIKP
jgi:glutaredoxin 3